MSWLSELRDCAQRAQQELSVPGTHKRPARDALVETLNATLAFAGTFELKCVGTGSPRDDLSMHPLSYSPHAEQGPAPRAFDARYPEAEHMWRTFLKIAISSKTCSYFDTCSAIELRMFAVTLIDELAETPLSRKNLRGRNRALCVCQQLLQSLGVQVSYRSAPRSIGALVPAYH